MFKNNSDKKNNALVTTAIPYVNADPHIGFALEIVQADTIARYLRLCGNNVYFLTGTDENSLKNVRAAKKQGVPTQKLVDTNAKRFEELGDVLNISFDDFIRTTEPRHITGAQKLWKACKKDIYKKSYTGLYCVGCEQFYKQSELENGLCPEHQTKPEKIEEENYFFRLSNYQEELLELYKNNRITIVPDHRKNEVLAFIQSGLEDFSISRSIDRAHGWGIPVPEDASQIMYVWFDALTNYINAVGYSNDKEQFQKYWQSNNALPVHVIGKGVLRFHAIYWPAMLLSAGLNLPDTIFVHGYITAEGQKMSKSIGNVIHPKDITEEWGIDPVRYFLLREIPATEDGDYSHQRLLERYNGDLANGLGNLVSRCLALIAKQESVTIGSNKLHEEITDTWKSYHAFMRAYNFSAALESIWKLIAVTDKYINDERPWKQENADKLQETLSSIWFSLAHISQLLLPFMPETAKRIADLSRVNTNTPWKSQKLHLEKPDPLFQKKED